MSSQENGGAAAGCSNVASGPTAAELLELVDAAIIALDAGESAVARVRLRALAEAVRTWSRLAGGSEPAPNERHALVKRFVSSAFIGLPCPMNAAGIRGLVVSNIGDAYLARPAAQSAHAAGP